MSTDPSAVFSDPAFVARYAEGPPRQVPGFADLHRMTGMVLAERAPADARVLVVGAGGGLEIKALAGAYPGWTFLGVDPAPPMLDLARQVLGPDAARVTLLAGHIDDVRLEPFDAAASLLTLYFLDVAQRVYTLIEIRRRLKPGAPFVMAHACFPKGEAARAVAFSRHAGFPAGGHAGPDDVARMRANLEANLHLLDAAEEEAILREAGFTGVQQFYAAFAWRAWVAYA